VSIGGRGVKAVVMRIMENVFNEGREAEARRVIDPDAPQGPRSPRAALAFVGHLRDAFPDLRFEVEDLVAEDDRVACSWVLTGTHLAPFLGVPPTEAAIRTTGITIFEIRGGRWHAATGNWDLARVLGQIGVPLPGVAPPQGGA
jgi:steroid delta-isomerase-like uncharacterized protein